MPDSGFWTSDSRFQLGPAPLACQFLITGFQFSLSDSSLDLLHTLLDFWLQVSSRAVVRSHGSSPDSSFWLQISVWSCSARCSVSGFQFPVGLVCSCSAPARTPVSGARFQILIQTPSARFSISGFRFLARLSCDCPAPARIPVACFQFQIQV